ncbi:hypothetical protein [Flavobacterium frigoris]|uniref:Uncharacterized protein n=1 Tax=Flavobacterium frigoris TaxID=229204 RepID=A0A1H9J6S8_FLAFI|nr:hypothetical protein [Flavobacterium frigoris]SEQ82513.1 hypothetical protein SAMN05444355_104230 [Flavobacterium frigoris]
MKYLLSSSCIGIFLIFNIQAAFSQEEYKEVTAKIEVEKVEDALSITGMVENLKSEYKNISFELAVQKKNTSNTNSAINKQSGRFTLEPLKKISLSSTKINVSKEDQIIISLFIYNEKDILIGKDRIVVENEKKKII